MPGGIVNGVSWASSAALLSEALGGVGTSLTVSAAQAAVSDGSSASGPEEHTAIIVPTVLQMTTDAVNFWTGLTCLYDPYHIPEEGRDSLPICMFHVKKITSTFTNEVSKKRVILYEPVEDTRASADIMADPLRAGVMQTVVDNVVKNPRTYNMEVIVPFKPVGRYMREGFKTITDMLGALRELLYADDAILPWVDSAISSVYSGLNAVRSTLAIAEETLPSLGGASYINMNSLEAMADSCRTLCMKMWTGYDYKFVLITNMSYDKDPKEDDVFRATLSLQEMPVLAISKPGNLKTGTINLNPVSALQSASTIPLKMLTGVAAAAGGKSKISEAALNVKGG
jgi:hypothetical protein